MLDREKKPWFTELQVSVLGIVSSYRSITTLQQIMGNPSSNKVICQNQAYNSSKRST